MALDPTPTIEQLQKPGTHIVSLGEMLYQGTSRPGRPELTMELYYFIDDKDRPSVAVCWEQEGTNQTLAHPFIYEDENIDPHIEEAFRRTRERRLIA